MRHARLVIVLIGLWSAGCARPRVAVDRDLHIDAMMQQIDPNRIRATVEKLVSFKTRHTLSDTESQTEGIGAARRWIQSQFEQYSSTKNGRLLVETQEVHIDKPTERIPRPVTIVNVLATLPGRRAAQGSDARKRVVIVSGHYDSRALDANDATSPAPGANDDASGTALVMELARVMSGYQFDETIIFACVAGEEQGLNGSAGLADRAKRENWDVIAMLNNDIVGNTSGGSGVRDASRVRLFSEGVPSNESPVQMQARQSIGGENDAPSRQLARYIKEVAAPYVPGFDVTMIYRRDRYGRGGDHIPFLRQGYPAVRFTEPNEDFSRQHQDITQRSAKPYGDLPQFMDFKYIANVARVNATAIAALASAPPSPKRVHIDASPSYDTSLEWDAIEDPAIDGYAVLLRETTAPNWQRRIELGNVTSTTLRGINKDDFLIAVESYDARGHRSLPVVPTPRRANAPATRDVGATSPAGPG